LVDDNAAVRAMVRQVLEGLGAEVIGEASDGQAALDAVSECRPDVVVMDISMPRMNGIEALKQLKQDQPGIRVILLSMYDGRELIRRALALGADAYVTKGSGCETVEEAWREVVEAGGTYLCPRAARALESVPAPAES
jgi:two-component system nitrate/nitrite response regulator NarL